MTMTKETARTEARAQMASVGAMVERLEHARSCSQDGQCGATDAATRQGLDLDASHRLTNADREQYHDSEEAELRIQEDALSVEVRSGWVTPGQPMVAVEYAILLCTGGPAVRIRGEIGDPVAGAWTADIEYQDWGTPWTLLFDASPAQRAALLTYAREFLAD